MSSLVCVLALPHDPTLPAALRAHPVEEPFGGVRSFLERQRATLAAAQPDVLIMVAGDHLNQWFLDNMPAFLIGKAPRTAGPFPEECRAFGIGELDVPNDAALARHLLTAGLARGIDWAMSNEYMVDHAFTIPLSFVRPENDLPVVPVFTNVLTPPLPPARRFYEVGLVLRETVEAWHADRRVAILVTGHMTNNVGGPRMLDFLREPLSDWDRQTWSLVERWELDRLIEEATLERLDAAGHATPAWLDVILGFGAAGGVAPTEALMGGAGAMPVLPLLTWDEPTLAGVPRSVSEAGDEQVRAG